MRRLDLFLRGRRISAIAGLLAVLQLGFDPAASATGYPPLPLAVASFGAAVADGSLFVYGGHVGKTHSHSQENLSQQFLRLDLGAPERGWQELGPVPGLQGLPLVAHGRKVCRVGGLSARNHQGEEEDLVSRAEVTCFDPQTGQWQDLPPLPAPRSSHDALVVGDRLYVVGGWQLGGKGVEPRWHRSAAELDLAAPQPAWKELPQPFERRALALATTAGRIYALGGMSPEGTSQRVDVYDPGAQTWETAPDLPAIAGPMRGFGLAALGARERIFLSGADGVVHALASGSPAWEKVGQLASPRLFHRLLEHQGELLFVAGAAQSGHLDSVESLPLAALSSKPTVPEAPENVASAAWIGFRGDGSGQAHWTDLPLHWSETENLAWRVALPGYGQSSPVVWGDQVYVTSVEGPRKEALILSALSLSTGEVRWRRRFSASQQIESTEMVSRAAPTPAVDGERIYAFWESGDLLALDHQGETLWRRSLTTEYGPFLGNHGVASSLLLSGGVVVVQVTHDGPSYLLAVETATGKNRWKLDRPAKVAWTSPMLAAGPDGPEIVSSATGRVDAVDARTGELRWLREGVEKHTAASAVVAPGRVIVASSEPGQSLVLRHGGRGVLGDDQVLWRAQGVSSGFGSPLVVGGCVLFTNKTGVLSCLDFESGVERWTHRLPEATWASPIGSENHAFFFTKKGRTVVLGISLEGPEAVAESTLPTDDSVYGVAAVPGSFLIRSGRELVRVGIGVAAEETELAARR